MSVIQEPNTATPTFGHRSRAEQCRRVALICTPIGVVIGLGTLLGWVFGVGPLGERDSIYTLAPSVSLGFVIFGSALFWHLRDAACWGARVYGVLAALVTAGWGLVRLVQCLAAGYHEG